MLNRITLTFSLLLTIQLFYTDHLLAQIENEAPDIYYSAAQKYIIGGIKVTGNNNYEESLLIKYSGLVVGSEITVPGSEITTALKNFWRQGLFSDVRIIADRIEGKNIFLEVQLKERPRLGTINYHGLKKSEITDLEESSIRMIKGTQVTPNLINNTKKVVKNIFYKKGFHNVEVSINQKDDLTAENQVIIDIFVDKKEKVKIEELLIEGNTVLSKNKINRVMKKTNEKGKLRNFFRSKKFITEEYEADKIALIDKYNEEGYRDAILLSDSISPGQEENTIKVHLKIDEGQQYFFRNINWVGNSQYTAEYLNNRLRIKKGDVYNQKLLSERLEIDDDAINNLYLDNGYLFFNLTPVEVMVDQDSIDLEMRITEGNQATINKVIINGNTRTHEHVARRELRIKPGQLFSKADIIRSVRELAQIGQFDPEQIEPIPKPNPEDGTVDIVLNLVEKATDQVELSGGWGAGMFVGTLGLSFNNFSIRNIFNKESYHPLPSGDGQTLSVRGQTNGQFYQSYSLSFHEPWLGGKRPNSLSVSAYYSIQTGSNQYDNSSYYSPYSSYGGYSPYSSYGSSYGGYGNYGNYGYNTDYSDYEATRHMKVIGASVGLGKRLSWPDDFFTLYNELSFQHYDILNWSFLGFSTGKANNLNFTTTLSRNSVDNPIYSRSGSNFSASLQITPPYSVFSPDKDWENETSQEKYKWIEYHKWKFKGVNYTPISPNGKLVLMTKAEFGYLGNYTSGLESPFEKFNLGGDGMSGYSLYGSETIGLRGYENSSVSTYGGSNIYTKYAVEVRYPFVLETSTTIFGLGFVEAGNAWDDPKQFNPFSVKRSAGIGLRIFLPMFGMMGIDWGYGFDDINGSYSESGSQFHFVIGQQF